VNTFTNGHWTCKKHASHPSIPIDNWMTSFFNERRVHVCGMCQENIYDVEDLCRTSCEHTFHTKCFLKHARRFASDMDEETRCNCPSCLQELCVFGLEPSASEFEEIANYPIDDDMIAFIDSYIETHDMSFLES
jgi:hypothetical protein